MAEKKTFTAQKIRTSEICGVDGELIVNSESISGASGTFDELTVGGVKYIPRDQIAYGFRFGGPPIDVPSGLPFVTGSSPQLFTGLASGHNYVFVEEASSFASGDHIIINPGGLYSDGNPQEEQTITGISYYRPSDGCNATIYDNTAAGQGTIYHNNERSIAAGNKVIFGNSDVDIHGHQFIYDVTETIGAGNDLRGIKVTPTLRNSIPISGCICVVAPTLETENNLFHNYPIGTKVARKYANTSTSFVGSGTSGDPYWNNVVLLVQSNNQDGETVFEDTSLSDHTVTGYGNVQHKSGEYKFGNSSMYFDGTGDYLKIPHSTNFNFNNFDATIEFWYKHVAHSTQGDDSSTVDEDIILSKGRNNSTATGWLFRLSNPANSQFQEGLISFTFYDGFSVGNAINTTQRVDDGNWYHIAATKNNGNSNWSLFLNGTGQGSVTDYVHNFDNADNIVVGAGKRYQDGVTGNYANFYLEDLRITNTIRYTNDFIAPTQNFDNFLRAPDACSSTCYDTRYLYVDKGVYTGDFDWHLTGYREYFIDFSGVDVHITGDNKTGLLTLVYPDEGI
jgi:hypothetical protein